MGLDNILDAVASGGAVAVLALIIFMMYRSDKKEEWTRLCQERDAEIERWKEQVDQYKQITQDMIDCRNADSASREVLAKNLGELAESIRSCEFRERSV